MLRHPFKPVLLHSPGRFCVSSGFNECGGRFQGLLSRRKASRLEEKEPRDQRGWGQSARDKLMCIVIGVVMGTLGVVNLEEGKNGLSGDQWRTG